MATDRQPGPGLQMCLGSPYLKERAAMRESNKDKVLEPFLMKPVEVTGVVSDVRQGSGKNLYVCLRNPVFRAAGKRVSADHAWVPLWDWLRVDSGLVKAGAFVMVVGYVNNYKRSQDGSIGYGVRPKVVSFAP